MTITIATEGSPNVLAAIANPAVRAVLLAGAAGLGLTAFRVKATSLRLFTWTAVLYGALAMPLLGWILPTLSVPVPGFLQHQAAPILQNQVQDAQRLSVTATPPVHRESRVVLSKPRNSSLSGKSSEKISSRARMTEAPDQTPQAPVLSSAASPSPPQAFSWSSIRWSVVAAGIYLAVAVLLLVRFVVGIVFCRRLLRASQTIREARVTQRLVARGCINGLSFVPRAAECELISVPLTMGVVRSIILLPVDWQEWDDAKLDAVIAHEVSHVARRDALTQRLSLLHRAVFWFSPLAWWLDHHLADLAEQASDEAALACGANRTDYARTLLGFFEALHAAPGRVWWQGVSMAKAGQAEQRLERILAWRGAVTMSLKKSVAVAVIALAIPAVYLAAAVRPANHYEGPQDVPHSQDQTPPAAPSAAPEPALPPQDSTPASSTDALLAPAVAPARIASWPTPPPPRAPVASVVSLNGHTVIAPVAPKAPRAVMPPPAIWSGQSSGSGSSHGAGYSYAYGYDDEERFVIVSGKSDSYTMSGSRQDILHVEKLKKQISGPFIWFQRDEKSYVIRDQATIDRALAFWAPEEELGKKQEELGKQQEVLGKQQEALGAKMEQIQVKVPDITAALDRLKAKLQKLGPTATVDQIGDLQSEIGELQSKIGDIQSQAGDQQGKLGEEQGKLGEQQGKLGEEQGKLGEEQGKLAEQAARQMKGLLDEAIKSGTAQPEPGGQASL
jgi:beta-lactamase regulating signal transducer with metallopeptidase domain